MILTAETVLTDEAVKDAQFDLIAMHSQHLISGLTARAKHLGYKWKTKPTVTVTQETIVSENSGNEFIVHHLNAKLVTTDKGKEEVIA